jgi:hypothetical protein
VRVEFVVVKVLMAYRHTLWKPFSLKFSRQLVGSWEPERDMWGAGGLRGGRFEDYRRAV